MPVTDYQAEYLAYELTKRCPSDSVEKLTGAVPRCPSGELDEDDESLDETAKESDDDPPEPLSAEKRSTLTTYGFPGRKCCG